MKTGLARIISLLLVIVLAVGCLAPLTACKGSEETPSGDNSGNGNNGNNPGGSGNNNPAATSATYEVTVSTRYGMPLKNIWAVIYDSADNSQTVDQAKTDANGKVSFKLDSSKTYTVKLEGVPDGYQVGNNSFSFDAAKKADIQLTSAPISDGDISDVDMYKVGDVIHDFFLTDVNGEECSVDNKGCNDSRAHACERKILTCSVENLLVGAVDRLCKNLADNTLVRSCERAGGRIFFGEFSNTVNEGLAGKARSDSASGSTSHAVANDTEHHSVIIIFAKKAVLIDLSFLAHIGTSAAKHRAPLLLIWR